MSLGYFVTHIQWIIQFMFSVYNFDSVRIWKSLNYPKLPFGCTVHSAHASNKNFAKYVKWKLASPLWSLVEACQYLDNISLFCKIFQGVPLQQRFFKSSQSMNVNPLNHIHPGKFDEQVAPLAIFENLATRWRHLYREQCITCIFGYQVTPLVLVANLATCISSEFGFIASHDAKKPYYNNVPLFPQTICWRSSFVSKKVCVFKKVKVSAPLPESGTLVVSSGHPW